MATEQELKDAIEVLKADIVVIDDQIIVIEQEVSDINSNGQDVTINIEPGDLRQRNLSIEEMRRFVKLVNASRTLNELIATKDGQINVLRRQRDTKKTEIRTLASELIDFTL